MTAILEDALWNVEVLPSAARTTAQTVDLIKPHGAVGVYVTVDVTVDPALASVTPKIQYATAASSPKFETLLSGTAIAAVGVFTYLLALGVGTASEDVTKVAGFALPRNWRFSMAVNDGDSLTYSVMASYV